MKRRTAVNNQRLFSGAKGFDVGNDLPAIIDGDGRMQGRLPAVGNTVADVFEKDAGRAVLDFGAAQIGRQRRKALTHGAVTVVIVTMALGAIDAVHGFSSVNDGRLRHIDGGYDVDPRRYAVDGFTTVDWNQTGFLDQKRLFVRSHGWRFAHAAVAEVVVIIDQCLVNHQKENSNSDEKSYYFFHLLNAFIRNDVKLRRIFFPALLFEHMLRIGKRMIGITDRIRRFAGNIFDRPVVPIGLAKISD